MRTTIQPGEARIQRFQHCPERTSILRPVFALEPSAGKWLETDRSDFLSKIDLRVALFLPTEQDR